MKLLVIAYQHNIFKGYKAKKRIEPFIEQNEHKRNHFYSKRNLKLKNAFYTEHYRFRLTLFKGEIL